MFIISLFIDPITSKKEEKAEGGDRREKPVYEKIMKETGVTEEQAIEIETIFFACGFPQLDAIKFYQDLSENEKEYHFVSEVSGFSLVLSDGIVSKI